MFTALGPRSTWRIATKIGLIQSGRRDADQNRRRFLGNLATLFGAVAILQLPFRLESKSKTEQGPLGGEMYHGFILVPGNSDPPPWIHCTSVPVTCAAGNQNVDPDFLGEEIPFSTLEQVRDYVHFKLYSFNNLPAPLQVVSINVLQFAKSKHAFMVTMGFGKYNPSAGAVTPTISLWAQPDFPRPYPIYPAQAYNSDTIVAPEKVSITPEPGVMLPTGDGHLIQWIKGDVLYTLVAEDDPSREAAINLVSALVEV